MRGLVGWCGAEDERASYHLPQSDQTLERKGKERRLCLRLLALMSRQLQ